MNNRVAYKKVSHYKPALAAVDELVVPVTASLEFRRFFFCGAGAAMKQADMKPLESEAFVGSVESFRFTVSSGFPFVSPSSASPSGKMSYSFKTLFDNTNDH